MLFAIFIFLLLLAVVFFHYLQGFFSATLSAFFAVIAAVVAVSYHEWVVEQFLGNAMGDWGPPLVTLGMFAVTYLIFRLIFDKAIPGQIRLPSTMDKIGGAVMGLVAGTFALGTVVIAAQQMPLGASIAGYVRYETNSTRGIVVPTGFNTRAKDANAYDEVVGDNFDTAAPKGIVMVDDVVVCSGSGWRPRRAARCRRPTCRRRTFRRSTWRACTWRRRSRRPRSWTTSSPTSASASSRSSSRR
jgi:hypothetical protein